MRHDVIADTSRMLVLPHIDPHRNRSTLTVRVDTTVADMVALALPGVAPVLYDRVRVTIGDHVIPKAVWGRVRPRPGATVIVRVVPGDDNLRSILSVAVLVAAVALGQYYAPAIAGSLLPAGFTATATTLNLISSVTTAAFAVGGSLLTNALVPVRPLDDGSTKTDVYAISGLQNKANPGGVIPSILGQHRYAPPYAATPYTEVIGDDQYVIAPFLLGHGPLNIRNHRIGDTLIDGNFSNVEMEVRQGYPDDAPVTLYPRQVVEEQLTIQLTSASGAQRRFTALDASGASIDITFVQGLVGYDDKGKAGLASVGFQLMQRKVGDPTFEQVSLIIVNGAEQKIIRRTFRWDFPERGQYEIQLARLTGDTNNPKIQDRSDWSALRSFRPESPFNFKKPVAMVVLRIRASNQLNGIVNNYNSDAAIICPDWDSLTQAWIVRETRNPASLYRHVLQGPANAYPKTDDQIDLAGLQDWHEFCFQKGLTYNRVHDYNATRLDVLADIAAAGRATPHDDGVRWGVTIDRPQTSYVGAISPRNSWDFQGSTPQILFPDGHRVQFIDETSGYQQAERVVPFPGVNSNAVAVTEDMSHPGITDPDLIWKETRRRQYELIHRPHTYTASQDFESLVLRRGDLTLLNHDVLDRDHVPSRVRSVSGQVIGLDTPVTMQVGRTYAISIRKSDGTSIRRAVQAADGQQSSIWAVGDLSGVEAGDLALFGTSLKGPALDVVVKNIERGDNLTATLTLIDAAPQIDALVDAEVPPPWDGRVGGETDVSMLVPAVPSFTITDNGSDFLVALVPGTDATAPTADYVVSYRLHGGGAFTDVIVGAVQGIVGISGFIYGDTIDVKSRARSAYGIPSAETAIQQATMTEIVTVSPLLDNTNYSIDTIEFTLDHT